VSANLSAAAGPEVPTRVWSSPASQQPRWPDTAELRRVRRELAARPALVTEAEVVSLQAALVAVVDGDALVLQAGDCAEDPAECGPADVSRKAGLLDVLAGTLRMVGHRPVVRVGRIAGQFAKPRSAPTERVGGLELPVYRGHMVNGPEPEAATRVADPRRLLTGYDAAAAVLRTLGRPTGAAPVWTSHEALLLDYELSMVRPGETGRPLLGSTHWPWIGERTRQVHGPHVDLLASVVNPVACKVGPGTTPTELTALCAVLDPDRVPGRLSLIARIGAGRVADVLPGLVAAVRTAGHPAVWLCDPMHANTAVTAGGLKTRYVDRITAEVRGFLTAVRAGGGVPGGLHLETTPDDVTECVPNESCSERVGDRYRSLCDPRLDPAQAVAVVSAWSA